MADSPVKLAEKIEKFATVNLYVMRTSVKYSGKSSRNILQERKKCPNFAFAFGQEMTNEGNTIFDRFS